jgi:hypothetical protein
MGNKNYNLTDNAPRELKRKVGKAGTITMSDRAARFELRRGTIELPGATTATAPTVQTATIVQAVVQAAPVGAATETAAAASQVAPVAFQAVT